MPSLLVLSIVTVIVFGPKVLLANSILLLAYLTMTSLPLHMAELDGRAVSQRIQNATLPAFLVSEATFSPLFALSKAPHIFGGVHLSYETIDCFLSLVAAAGVAALVRDSTAKHPASRLGHGKVIARTLSLWNPASYTPDALSTVNGRLSSTATVVEEYSESSEVSLTHQAPKWCRPDVRQAFLAHDWITLGSSPALSVLADRVSTTCGIDKQDLDLDDSHNTTSADTVSVPEFLPPFETPAADRVHSASSRPGTSRAQNTDAPSLGRKRSYTFVRVPLHRPWPLPPYRAYIKILEEQAEDAPIPPSPLLGDISHVMDCLLVSPTILAPSPQRRGESCVCHLEAEAEGFESPPMSPLPNLEHAMDTLLDLSASTRQPRLQVRVRRDVIKRGLLSAVAPSNLDPVIGSSRRPLLSPFSCSILSRLTQPPSTSAAHSSISTPRVHRPLPALQAVRPTSSSLSQYAEDSTAVRTLKTLLNRRYSLQPSLHTYPPRVAHTVYKQTAQTAHNGKQELRAIQPGTRLFLKNGKLYKSKRGTKHKAKGYLKAGKENAARPLEDAVV